MNSLKVCIKQRAGGERRQNPPKEHTSMTFPSSPCEGLENVTQSTEAHF